MYALYTILYYTIRISSRSYMGFSQRTLENMESVTDPLEDLRDACLKLPLKVMVRIPVPPTAMQLQESHGLLTIGFWGVGFRA